MRDRGRGTGKKVNLPFPGLQWTLQFYFPRLKLQRATFWLKNKFLSNFHSHQYVNWQTLWQFPDLMTKERFLTGTADIAGESADCLYLSFSTFSQSSESKKKEDSIQQIIWWTSKGWIKKEWGFGSQDLW